MEGVKHVGDEQKPLTKAKQKSAKTKGKDLHLPIKYNYT